MYSVFWDKSITVTTKSETYQGNVVLANVCIPFNFQDIFVLFYKKKVDLMQEYVSFIDRLNMIFYSLLNPEKRSICSVIHF